MVAHGANLSGPEAARRARSARALRRLPECRDALRSGRIGACQVERIARAHANPRITGQVEANDTAFATQAATDEYRVFDRKVTSWTDLVDEDGARDRDQRNHDNRDAKLVQDLDGSWRLTGSFGSLQGAELHSILGAFTRMEGLADWDRARAAHGDAATVADLARTENQRRADALAEIFRRAAAHHAASEGGSPIVTDIVIDHDTFERLTRQLLGADPHPGAANGGGDGRGAGGGDGGGGGPFPAPRYRCSTLDGHPVEATAAVANALVGHIRRVLIDSDSVVIDLGRRSRCFTGAAALAVKLSNETCYWPGCHVPVTACQCDHLISWADNGPGGPGGGCTCPRNGGPGCGQHNRFKYRHDYTAHRDPDGTWHIHRPDGTPID